MFSHVGGVGIQDGQWKQGAREEEAELRESSVVESKGLNTTKVVKRTRLSKYLSY